MTDHHHPRRDAHPAQRLPAAQAPARLSTTSTDIPCAGPRLRPAMPRFEGQPIVIERNWNELIRPEKPQIETGADASRKARLVAEPLERGFGVTLGNACAASCSPRCKAPR